MSLNSKWLMVNRLRKGQSLLDVVVAVGIVAALAVALITTILFTQRASRSTASTTQASKLVQQNIEQMRIFRDRQGFSSFPASDGNCFILNSDNPIPTNWELNVCPAETPSGKAEVFNNVTFFRRIAISTQSPNKKKVVVTASWTDSQGLPTVANTTILTNLANSVDSQGPC